LNTIDTKTSSEDKDSEIEIIKNKEEYTTMELSTLDNQLPISITDMAGNKKN